MEAYKHIYKVGASFFPQCAANCFSIVNTEDRDNSAFSFLVNHYSWSSVPIHVHSRSVPWRVSNAA